MSVAGYGYRVRKQRFPDCDLDKIRVCLKFPDFRYNGRHPLIDDHIKTRYRIQCPYIPQIVDIIGSPDNSSLHPVPLHYIHKVGKHVIRHIKG